MIYTYISAMFSYLDPPTKMHTSLQLPHKPSTLQCMPEWHLYPAGNEEEASPDLRACEFGPLPPLGSRGIWGYFPRKIGLGMRGGKDHCRPDEW